MIRLLVIIISRGVKMGLLQWHRSKANEVNIIDHIVVALRG